MNALASCKLRRSLRLTVSSAPRLRSLHVQALVFCWTVLRTPPQECPSPHKSALPLRECPSPHKSATPLRECLFLAGMILGDKSAFFFSPRTAFPPPPPPHTISSDSRFCFPSFTVPGHPLSVFAARAGAHVLGDTRVQQNSLPRGSRRVGAHALQLLRVPGMPTANSNSTHCMLYVCIVMPWKPKAQTRNPKH